MTGRDLIIYILSNGLEDEPVYKNGRFIGFLTAGEVAEKMHVGTATVGAWMNRGMLDGIRVDAGIYIPADFKLPDQVNRKE